MSAIQGKDMDSLKAEPMPEFIPKPKPVKKPRPKKSRRKAKDRKVEL
jgi:hypothetical protein